MSKRLDGIRWLRGLTLWRGLLAAILGAGLYATVVRFGSSRQRAPF